MPYRTGAPAPPDSCPICHATLEAPQSPPVRGRARARAQARLCDRCARGRRRARVVSYAFLAAVLAGGVGR